MKNVSIFALVAIFAVSCASGAQQEVGTTAKKPSQTIVDDPPTTSNGDKTRCEEAEYGGSTGSSSSGSGDTSFSLRPSGQAQGDIVSIRGDSTYVTKNSKTVSLCKVLLDSGKKAAVFQFAGIECTSCWEDAPDIDRRIKALSNGRDIAHIVVLTDLHSDYSESEFQGFMTKYAPNAIRVDDEGKVWKSFYDPEHPRSAIMTMNLDMEAIQFWNRPEYFDVFNAAKYLAEKIKD